MKAAPPATNRRRSIAILAAFGLVLAIIATAYTVHAIQRSAATKVSAAPSGAPTANIFDGKPQLVFRNTNIHAGYGEVASVPLGDPGGTRSFTNLACDRVYAAADHILCLTSKAGVITTYSAIIYDKNLNPIKTVSIPGQPSRARLSADGRMANWTVFVFGDSYVSRNFSTRTAILDIQTGQLLPNLETFKIIKNGVAYTSPDDNFWGVTFATDDNTFYATLATQGQTYLVKGDLAARTVTTLRTNVECPSLSPDGTRIVFKKRVSSNVQAPWRFAVLDLATMKETLLAETRSIDDQAAWLDNQTVIYSLPEAQNAAVTDLWKVPSDGSGKPQMVLQGGFSPATVAS
jgi:hypothetical protein